MGNERDYDGEYERDREQELEFDNSWSSLAKEGQVYEFEKLTPVPANYYQKRKVTNSSLSAIEEYRGSAAAPRFNFSPSKTNL